MYKTQTAPMGWNSWDCYGAAVTEDIVRQNAAFMAEHLKQYGWEYVVVDFLPGLYGAGVVFHGIRGFTFDAEGIGTGYFGNMVHNGLGVAAPAEPGDKGFVLVHFLVVLGASGEA